MSGQKDEKCYNILLMGEAGEGKSTLINSFANYCVFKTFKEAIEGQEICLITTKFSIFDNDYKSTTITVGPKDLNEDLEEGQSGTLSCKSYVFKLNENIKIRFIDSSGYADTKGLDMDIENLEDILDYVAQNKDIHAFAMVIAATQTSKAKQMEHFYEQMFARLGGEALQNIIFIFTQGKKPQNGLSIAKSVFETITKSFNFLGDKQMNKKNIFCFDNTPFIELIKIKQKLIEPDEDEMKASQVNWEASINEFQRLINEVMTLKPYNVCRPLKGQEAIEYIRNLSAIAGVICSHIDENTDNLKSSETNINLSSFTKIKLNSQENPITICLANKKCNYSSHEVKDQYKYYGKNACCEGCQLKFGRRSCSKMVFLTAICQICKCNLKEHQFIFYTITTERDDKVTSVETATELVNRSKDEKAAIVHGMKQLIECIKSNFSHKNVEEVETEPFGLSKLLFQKSWKGNPSEIIFEVKNELEKMTLYGEIIRQACATNEKYFQEANKKRDVKVEFKNQVFNVLNT